MAEAIKEKELFVINTKGSGKKNDSINPEKKRALEAATLQIEKQFGKGSIYRLGDPKAHKEIESIPTGALSLDIALGIGGVPRGRVIEVYGPESSGKTTLTLSIVAQAQKLGGIAAFIDAEHAMDPVYSRKLGVDVDNLLVSQPDSGEEALEIAEALVRSNAIDILVIDSVAALVPKAEIDREMGEPTMGVQARLMSQALRKLTGTISKSRTCVIFINQIRMKIGVMFGNPETTTGGNALKFYSSVRLDIRRIESLKKGDEIYGTRVKVKVVKNKVAPPFKIAEFEIHFSKGISKESCLLDIALKEGIISRAGTWFSYGAERIGQGRANAIAFLEEHAKIADEIEKKARKNAFGDTTKEKESAPETEKSAADDSASSKKKVK